MENIIGKQAKVTGYESVGSHGFKLGEIVTFLYSSDNDETWYTFKNEDNFVQDLIKLEFEWIESE